MDDKLVGGGVAAGLFGIYADLAYNCYSATNSSPQTTELFASEREETLMKYVYAGHAQAFAIGIVGSILARKWWPLLGVSSIAVIMHFMYEHARASGVDQPPPTT